MVDILEGKTVLVTGGTGSFGKKFVKTLLTRFKPKKVIVFSRDEFKHYQMQRKFPKENYPNLRFFLGDIRDKERLYRAFEGVDYVIHAAALKHVPILEYNPSEAVKTNIYGAQNIINAAIDQGVKKVIALSTDKAVNPVNLYGATKLAMEKLFIAANAYTGSKETIFAVVRYGNVVGSRGSVIPFFKELVKKGEKVLPITDERMTRFWITLEEGVETVLFALRESVGGEIFVPYLPSMKVVDLAKAICPCCGYKIIGIRPGEKLHETLLSEEESMHSVKVKADNGRTYFVVLPQFEFETKNIHKWREFESLPEGFIFRSDRNDWWLSVDELRKLIREI
ncbi:MAG TPA: UDP-N-acetylglucosamine 4,6-dehydratase (inverting) [Aquifex aeolicus]|uniref:UDP-N-acetylglucosamine 4,6-dehydratase (Inverting) n=1 Tax=Aquifex aeolicus TaxID=63363 RepID=A0A9D0YQ46_AQUAO|nr:UDP-N-acetylglucosamine 4,6-dehydratase (inverting) [Aquificales bacterium]HIP98832.1 UDP-N-acetylglucosamine 4,6-dehydratase (inverting) [Aquifex aeolicus]HIQ26520.1 UDP-N-acetylglucosamine 4,6-dehydratase (inverting) [Aquifex aeolicus]